MKGDGVGAEGRGGGCARAGGEDAARARGNEVYGGAHAQVSEAAVVDVAGVLRVGVEIGGGE
jgi:hypothetical protein